MFFFLQNIAISPLSLSDIKNTFTRPAKMESVKQYSQRRNNLCFSLWINNRKHISSIISLNSPPSWYLPLSLSLYSSFSFPVISKEAGADRSVMLTRLPRVLGGIMVSLVHNIFSSCFFKPLRRRIKNNLKQAPVKFTIKWKDLDSQMNNRLLFPLFAMRLNSSLCPCVELAQIRWTFN